MPRKTKFGRWLRKFFKRGWKKRPEEGIEGRSLGGHEVEQDKRRRNDALKRF